MILLLVLDSSQAALVMTAPICCLICISSFMMKQSRRMNVFNVGHPHFLGNVLDSLLQKVSVSSVLLLRGHHLLLFA